MVKEFLFYSGKAEAGLTVLNHAVAMINAQFSIFSFPVLFVKRRILVYLHS